MVIVDSSTGEVLGNCCLKAEKSNAELGYNISKVHWGKGIATEVARSMLEFGFRELKLQRIYATCRPENTGSYKVMEKIGMKREGHLREHFLKNGKWQDSYLYSILESEYVCGSDKGEPT
ncbi:putative ribosomal N-acetyltransferase YdaF [compost metagenome]